jgi:hypothetical protein
MTTSKQSLFDYRLQKIRDRRSQILDTIHNLKRDTNRSPYNIVIDEVVKGLYKDADRLMTIIDHMRQNQSTIETLNIKTIEVMKYLYDENNEVVWIEVARINDDGVEDREYRELYIPLEMNVAVGIWETYIKTHPKSEIKFHIDLDSTDPIEFDDFSYYTDIIDIGTTILTIAEIIEVYGGSQ